MGQTCCSGGVPLSSNLGFGTINQGNIQIALSYENNSLLTLYSGSDILEMNNRERNTMSLIGRLGYGISDRWSIEGLIPYIRQRRIISQNNGDTNQESSKGIGDVVIIGKYDLVKNISWVINLGVGAKYSTGSSDEVNNHGLLLVNDMQPGSGASDIISRLSVLYNLSVRPSTSVYLNTLYTYKGTDSEYLGSQSYQFGNEVQIISGITDQFIINDLALYPNLGLRYRNASRDSINDHALENTGGKWLYIRSGVGVGVYKNHRISFTTEFPLLTNVDGTQLSPDHIFNLTYSTIITGDVDPSFNINPKL